MHATNTLPSPLGPFESQTAVGTVGQAGSASYDPEKQVFRLNASGANVWGMRDACHFVYRQLRGDFILTANAAFVGAGVELHRKLGWMARASLEADAPQICTGIHGDGLLAL